MSLLDEVKRTILNLANKIKGSDNYLTFYVVLAGIVVLATVIILIFQFFVNTKILRDALNILSFQAKVEVTSTPTPTPTPIPLPRGPREFGVTNRQNPQFRSLKFDEYDPRKGEKQTITLKLVDIEGAKVVSVVVNLISDHQSKNYPLKLTSGTATDGEWSASWTPEDTHDYIYKLKITAINDKGQKNIVEPKFR